MSDKFDLGEKIGSIATAVKALQQDITAVRGSTRGIELELGNQAKQLERIDSRLSMLETAETGRKSLDDKYLDKRWALFLIMVSGIFTLAGKVGDWCCQTFLRGGVK